MIDAPVVVAGGSPIGMTLALELASHGVAALLGAYPSARSTISRRASPVILSRCSMGADISAVEICFAASSASAGDAHQEAQRFARAERGRSTHVSSAMLASCLLYLVALFVIVDRRFGVIASTLSIGVNDTRSELGATLNGPSRVKSLR
jgi:hypothetical protein